MPPLAAVLVLAGVDEPAPPLLELGVSASSALQAANAVKVISKREALGLTSRVMTRALPRRRAGATKIPPDLAPPRRDGGRASHVTSGVPLGN